jgi:esterase/lipase superfamily enzyme
MCYSGCDAAFFRVLPPMIRYTLLALAMLLSACGGPPRIAMVPDSAEIAATRTVFVATNRAFEDQRFTAGRSDAVEYTRFEVSIPPDREAGEISWARGQFDPNRDFGVSRADRYVSDAGFRADIARELRALPAENREVVVFIHGYNNNFASGLFRVAQLAHDYNTPGIVTHFSWPSAGQPFGYVFDRESAAFSRDALETFLRGLSAAGADRILLVGHSVGAFPTMETLRQIRISGNDAVLQDLSGVVLISPDIDIEVFQTQARALEPLPQPFVIFTSRQDRALRLAAGITGRENRLGTLGTIEDVAEFEITMIDLSEFDGGASDWANHSTFATSPTLIGLLGGIPAFGSAHAENPVGLLPGTVLTIRNATQILLTPSLP